MSRERIISSLRAKSYPLNRHVRAQEVKETLFFKGSWISKAHPPLQRRRCSVHTSVPVFLSKDAVSPNSYIQSSTGISSKQIRA